MPLARGTRLGPYEIVTPIGAGGMGEVYRARDTRLHRDVAIKVLPETIAHGSAWERFEREARAASALSHPHICAVYDVGEADGRPFLVMELLEGKTLRDYIGKEPVQPAAAVALAEQIADALEAAHAKGITHRDIKSGNIMVIAREHVKVLDFGLAKHTSTNVDETQTLDSLTAAGTVVGTPSYLAPELLQGKEADARSDLWAFGVVLYEMLSGRLPFNGPNGFRSKRRDSARGSSAPSSGGALQTKEYRRTVPGKRAGGTVPERRRSSRRTRSIAHGRNASGFRPEPQALVVGYGSRGSAGSGAHSVAAAA